ncbi:unnamed protein product [Penicillium salamii]|uniref:Uncharacterized protein n=1 Tax=Penicillium salamii TaxID=1612424 RepID=A0A9W4JW80_9EURO|nr:unnamed protein product [Penicillium salamii]
MLHRPFIRSIASMEALQDSQSPKHLHLQSATYSAIRITYIIRSFERFYNLTRLSPLTVTTLAMSSLIYLFNASTQDPSLVQRAKNLFEINIHALRHMNATTKSCDRIIRILQSIARSRDIQTSFDYNDVVGHGHHVENDQRIESNAAHHEWTVEPQTNDSQVPFIPDLSTTETGIPSSVDLFDWFELPLNDQLMDDGGFFDTLCAQSDWQYPCLEDLGTTTSFE